MTRAKGGHIMAGETPLLRALRARKPDRVVVVNGDDRKAVKVPHAGHRQRYQTVERVVAKMAWTECELLDADGAVLDVVVNEGAAGDVEELTDVGVRRDERLMGMLTRAVELGLRHSSDGAREANQALVGAVREISTANSMLAEVHRRTVGAAMELGELRGLLSGGDGGEVVPEKSEAMKALEAAAPFFLQRLVSSMVPPVKAQANGTAPRKANGDATKKGPE